MRDAKVWLFLYLSWSFSQNNKQIKNSDKIKKNNHEIINKIY